MATTRITAEQAQQCPKCHNVGEIVETKNTRYKNEPCTVYVMECHYRLCLWFMTRWVIQVDSDNTVLVRDSGHEPKSYPHMPKERVKTQAEVFKELDKMADDEVKP
jgi:hypothetical protein